MAGVMQINSLYGYYGTLDGCKCASCMLTIMCAFYDCGLCYLFIELTMFLVAKAFVEVISIQ